MTARNGTGRKRGLDRFLARLPLFFSYIILWSTWTLFTLFITLGEVLIKRREVTRFFELAITYNVLFFMTLISLITASTRSPGAPDQQLAPPLARRPPSPLPASTFHSSPTPNVSERHCELDDDDVPLRYLRNSQWVSTRVTKDRPSPLPLPSGSRYPRGPSTAGTTNSADTGVASDESEYSPFPLSAAPWSPATALAAGEADTDIREDEAVAMFAKESGVRTDGLGREEQAPFLLGGGDGENRSLMAKSSTGGARWCKKCDGWKPDRCHHCRHCDQCVLKMDHHCPWVGSCVGYHNYKPFLLFISYGTLLGAYATFEAGYESCRFFKDPDAAISHTQLEANGTAIEGGSAYIGTWADDIGLSPAVFMMLTVMGAFMTLSVGGLACFHWWLAAHNMTTLENITHAYPTALFDELPTSHAAPPSTSPTGSYSAASRPSPPRWKSDHLLTRRERQRLRWEAREINVYDLGWRRNLFDLFFRGESRVTAWGVVRAVWPLAGRVDRLDKRPGHFFAHDEKAYAKLKDLTMELRYGVERADADNSESSESESDDEGDEGDDEKEEDVREEEVPLQTREGRRDRGVPWFEA
ncbi:hypothetical protein IAT38_007007 [Cryptococcus sp. DSM 104549]